MNDAVKILVIDDSEDDRMFYSRVLHKVMGIQYNISEAADGEEGVKLIESVNPSCVLLDYSMPGRNGVEVLKQIRTKHPFVPVVMLTGQGNEKVAVTAMQEGAQNYIAKSSITPETLGHVVSIAIDHCALHKRINEQRTSLEVFTRAMAHDLKEPVRTIRSFSELITQNTQFSEENKRYFDHIQRASERMNMLIETVFLYTRLEGSEQMLKENCDMEKVLGEVKENLGQLLKEQGAEIKHGALPELYFNRVHVIQVLQNLICNAIRHSKKPVTINISAEVQGDYYLFRVADNGPGINEMYLQKIFEPFKRLNMEEESGSGLGLAICKKIIESYGGKIWCESKPGEGATFIFTTPKIKSEITTLPASPAATLAKAKEKSLANILLVDDRKSDLELTRIRLIEIPKLQCNLQVARNGEEAIDILQDGAGNPVDLMLLDINMPGMDGFEVLEHMKTKDMFKTVVVIMCTGSTYDKDIERAKSLGASGYLIKPVDFNALKEVIAETPNMEFLQKDNIPVLFRAAAGN